MADLLHSTIRLIQPTMKIYCCEEAGGLGVTFYWASGRLLKFPPFVHAQQKFVFCQALFWQCLHAVLPIIRCKTNFFACFRTKTTVPASNLSHVPFFSQFSSLLLLDWALDFPFLSVLWFGMLSRSIVCIEFSVVGIIILENNDFSMTNLIADTFAYVRVF